MKMYHASDFSLEDRNRIVDHVCEQITRKRPLYKVLDEDEGLCSVSTFIRWQAEDEEIQAKVARAREQAAEAYLDEVIEIADSDNFDAYVDGDGKVIKDGEAVARSKLRVYAREKYAQMIAPRKFGQKLDLTSAGQPLPTPVNQTVLIDARIQSLIGIAMQRRDDPREAEKRSLLDD